MKEKARSIWVIAVGCTDKHFIIMKGYFYFSAGVLFVLGKRFLFNLGAVEEALATRAAKGISLDSDQAENEGEK